MQEGEEVQEERTKEKTERPYRLLLHCRPESVTREHVEEALRKELGEEVRVRDFEIEAGSYYQEVIVQSGSRFVPVSIVLLRFDEKHEAPPASSVAMPVR